MATLPVSCGGTASGEQSPVTGDDEVTGPSSAAPAKTDDTWAVRRFLEDAGLVRSDEDKMKLSEMKPYVRGRLNR